MSVAFVLVTFVFLVFAAIVGKLTEREWPVCGRRASQSDGVPVALTGAEPTGAMRRRLARGSAAPPASLDAARVQFGELQGRRFVTPRSILDEAWERID